VDLLADLMEASGQPLYSEFIGGMTALIFEKDSTRTGFEVAAHHQGANLTYLVRSCSHIGNKKSTHVGARSRTALDTGWMSARIALIISKCQPRLRSTPVRLPTQLPSCGSVLQATYPPDECRNPLGVSLESLKGQE